MFMSFERRCEAMQWRNRSFHLLQRIARLLVSRAVGMTGI